MTVVDPQYPDQVWDGLTPNPDRESRNDIVDFNAQDWDQVSAEVISTQMHLDAIAIGPTGPIGATGSVGPTGPLGASSFIGGSNSRCRVYFDGHQTIPANVLTKITFNNVDFDDNSEWNTVNSLYTASQDGYYLIVGSLGYPNLDTLGRIYLRKNGSEILTEVEAQQHNGLLVIAYNFVYLESGDYIELCGYHTHSPNLEIWGGAFNTYLCIYKIDADGAAGTPFPSWEENADNWEAVRQAIYSRYGHLALQSNMKTRTLIPSPTAAWHLNEESGTRYDAIGSLDLTEVNTVGYAAGKIGNAASFVDDNHEWMYHLDDAALRIGDNDWQATVWVYINPGAFNPRIFNKWAAGKIEYFLSYYSPTQEFWFYTVHSTTPYVVKSSAFAEGGWHFISVRHKTADNTIGISIDNGVWTNASVPDGGTDQTDAAFRVGADGYATYWMDGLIDALHIWKGILLTDEQLAGVYASGGGKEVSNLGDFSNVWKWYGGVLASNGFIYGIPFVSTSILKINPNNDSFSTFGSLSGTYKWAGGVLAPNGCIYGIPRDSSSVLKIDPSDDSTSLIGSQAGTGKWVGGVLANNGKIYGIPGGRTNVLKIDPTTDTVSTFGDLAVGGDKWNGGVLAPNGCIYCIPYNSTTVLKIDPSDDSVSMFGDVGSGSLKWAGGVLAPNGMIYCIPYDSTTILKIDPTNDIVTMFGSLTGGNKWFGGVLAPDGCIYGFPLDSTTLLKIDPRTDTTILFGNYAGADKWPCGVLAPNGCIYGIPAYSGSVLKLGGGFDDVPLDFCLSRYFNKR